jgi:TolC family type I secretion outer membrane protein
MLRISIFPVLLSLSCATVLPGSRVDASVAPSPAQEWVPPQPRPTPSPATPPADLMAQFKPGMQVTLQQLLAYALSNNPQTRSAWLSARAAAAGAASRRSAYYPTINGSGQFSFSHTSIVTQVVKPDGTTGLGFVPFENWTLTPSASLTWLLLDFGGRSADVEEADRLLDAANLNHDATIQNLLLTVEQAYFQYQAAKGLLTAAQVTVNETQENLRAAEERRRAGLATIADVLQAKTQYSQAILAQQQAEGNVATIRGALATSLGVPANLPVDVVELPEKLDVQPLGESIDKLIERAQVQRPDLARARAQALAASSHADSIHSRGLPSLLLGGNASRVNYLWSRFTDCCYITYNFALTLNIPIFNGFKDTSDLLQAREQAKAAQADAESVEQQVILQVWQSYQAVKTAEKQLVSSQDLLASSRQSAEVAEGRYKAGVGSILDVLTAQTALANARAQDVQARANWLLSIASLAHDTGALGPGTPEAKQ